MSNSKSQIRKTPKVALVTGGGRGIGRGIVCALADNGWSVVINYQGNKISAEETFDYIKSVGAEGLVIQADISKLDDRQRLIEDTLKQFGRLDLLVNNAGIAPRQRLDILEVGEESYDEVLAVNLKGPFFLTQQVARVLIDLIESKTIESPRIVNISSISAYTSSPNRGEYCLSKAGMSMMTA